MGILRKKKERNFTTIANDGLVDSRLSFRARGLLAYLLTRPDHWRVDAGRLSGGSPEGRKAILTALKELETHGYLERKRCQEAHGRWVSYTWVYETPGAECVDRPQSPHRTSANRTSADGTLQQELRGSTERKEPPSSLSRSRVDATAFEEVRSALIEVCQIDRDDITQPHDEEISTAASELLKIRKPATPDDVRRRAVEYRTQYPDAPMTAKAIARRWPDLNPDAGAPSSPPRSHASATNEGQVWWCTTCDRHEANCSCTQSERRMEQRQGDIPAETF